MPIFEWICRDCDVFWDKEYPVGKAPQRTRCPECNKLSGRYYQNANVGVSFKDDGNCNRTNGANDFHTVRRRYQKVAEQGYDKDSADRFLRTQIAASKKAQTDETYRYRPVHMDIEKLAKDGKARKLSESESQQKQERARKLTVDAYDNANKRGYTDAQGNKLDPKKPQKQQ